MEYDAMGSKLLNAPLTQRVQRSSARTSPPSHRTSVEPHPSLPVLRINSHIRFRRSDVERGIEKLASRAK
jgi:hypothetical protein